MSTSKFKVLLATDGDGPAMASVVTAAFAACDAAYPLIWGAVPEEVHDMAVLKGMFSPVQLEWKRTFKAVDENGKVVGIATWTLPKPKPAEGQEQKQGGGGLPDLPGVNMELWNAKNLDAGNFAKRDKDEYRDMGLALFFVSPDYQHKGIGSLLLEWGKEKSNELGAKLWLTATPKAIPVYEKHGWQIIETYEVDLAKYGGPESYRRAWMLRNPT